MNNNSAVPVDDEPLTSPDDALALIKEQQRTVTKRQLGGIPWVFGVWGIAWGVGFLALWSGYDGGNPWFQLPLAVAGAIFGAIFLAASIVSVIVISRLGRGVRVASGFGGTVFGISSSASFVAVYLIGVALARAGADGPLISLYLPAGFGMTTGLLFLMGAALWRSVGQVVLGAIIMVTAVVAPFFGAPTNNVVMAVLGGGSFLIAAAAMHLGLKRGR